MWRNRPAIALLAAWPPPWTPRSNVGLTAGHDLSSVWFETYAA